MLNHCPDARRAARVCSLSLEDGADEQECSRHALEISERGMLLRSRWQFEIGTQLALVIVSREGPAESRRFAVEVLVVWCEAYAGVPETWETTLLFLDVSAELRADLCRLGWEAAIEG